MGRTTTVVLLICVPAAVYCFRAGAPSNGWIFAAVAVAAAAFWMAERFGWSPRPVRSRRAAQPTPADPWGGTPPDVGDFGALT